MFQYRITVEGQSSGVLNRYPGERWGQIAEQAEERGLMALFERRLITDLDILELVPDTTGYLTLNNRVACPWEVIASFQGATANELS